MSNMTKLTGQEAAKLKKSLQRHLNAVMMKFPKADLGILRELWAELLQVSRRTVVRWFKEGRLRGVRVGRLWRVREEDLGAS